LLAWQAANLLADDQPETAEALFWGGTWLKTRDVKTADLFYKTLVRRCRHTDLGREADRIRWFPAVNEEGRPVLHSAKDSSPGAEPSVPELGE
jgi:hypothetical protein